MRSSTTSTEQRYSPLNVRVDKLQPASDVAPEPSVERVAVLVCHGMGQQVQFETLDIIAQEVRVVAQDCGTATEKDVSVSLHPDGTGFIPRVELPLKRADGSRVDAHFYEAYWAPLTEGRITLRETLAFFVEAGLRGFRFAFVDGVFDRWMFGGRQEFEIPARRVLQLGLALWMLLLVAAGFGAVALLPVTKVVGVLRDSADAPMVAGLAAIAFSIGVFLCAFGVGAMIAARVLGAGSDTVRPKSVLDSPTIGILAPLVRRRVEALLMLLAMIVATGALTAWIGYVMYWGWLMPAVRDPSAHWFALSVATVAYLIEVVLFTRYVRAFLIQFAGDVAAYISPYKVSKFEEIRRSIQERGRRVARFVYSLTDGASDRALYDAVYLVGHSLGSVVAYDMLNDAINRDAHENGWGTGSPVDAFQVVQRSKLLLTFGSPLDKTAFVFRTQKMQTEFSVREALASATQPLIVSYANRACRWINVWSRSDWVSGPLGYYDAPIPPPERGVHNIEHVGSTFPATAHMEYWTEPIIRGVLHMALTGKCPGDVPEKERQQILAALRKAAPAEAGSRSLRSG